MNDREIELGEATIVYDDPDEDVVRKTVPNEHLAYFQDHWIVKMDDDDTDAHGDVVRRIPVRRVHYVERSVEEFEEEIETRIDQLQSFVEGLQTRLPIGRREEDQEEAEPERITIEEEPEPEQAEEEADRGMEDDLADADESDERDDAQDEEEEGVDDR